MNIHSEDLKKKKKKKSLGDVIQQQHSKLLLLYPVGKLHYSPIMISCW